MNLRDVGWVWEGQGLDPGVPASIYGLGQGARYFGLSRVNYLFHPNDEHALELMKDYDEVTCDITKWKWRWSEDGLLKCYRDSAPEVLREEARNVARLAERYTNITGAFFDDVTSGMKQHGYGPAEFAEVRGSIRDANADLTLWAVVYAREMDRVDYWRAMSPHLDVINLWVASSENLVRMDEYVDECRQLFPDQPIIMGVYLRDYGIPAPIPVDRVVGQMERIADLIDKGKLAGYSILASVLIDGQREQADAIRDFIAAH